MNVFRERVSIVIRIYIDNMRSAPYLSLCLSHFFILFRVYYISVNVSL